MSLTSSPYVNSGFVDNLNTIEKQEQTTINSAASQTLTNFNNVFTQVEINNLNGPKLQDAYKKFQKDYKYRVVDIIPSTNYFPKNAHLGCKTVQENVKTSNINMSRVDSNYYNFNTCSNKAAMLNKKYFSIVKPPPTSGVKDSNLFECHVGDDPLLKEPGNAGSNSYYKYVEYWSVGPAVTSFEITKETGDIVITADDINSLGITQQPKFSTNVEKYTYGGKKTYLPPNQFVSLNTYIFDLNQVTVTGGFMNGGNIGQDISISKIVYMPSTNKTVGDSVIVGINDGPYIKMIKLRLGMGGNSKFPDLPNDRSLYVKAEEARCFGGYRYVRITAASNADSYLQIPKLQVFDDNENDITQNNNVKVTAIDMLGTDYDTGPKNAIKPNGAMTSMYHSKTTNNPWWMITFNTDVNISKIVYYNRVDCCKDRIKGALLDGLDATGKVLFRKIMNGDDVQTFEVIPTNSFSLDRIWYSSNYENLVGNDKDKGYGIKGLTVRVSPVALGRGSDGYTITQNVQPVNSGNIYKILKEVNENACKQICDNDHECLGYTTSGDKLIPIDTDIKDLGCYNDGWIRAMNTYTGDGKNSNRNSCWKEARDMGHRFFGLQYGGQCFTTNDDSNLTGYPKYKKDSRSCAALGSDWQNHVYERVTINSKVTDCNFYKDITSTNTTASSGSNIFTRIKTSAPVNNTKIKLSNNTVTSGVSSETCGNKTNCTIYLELDNSGNLVLYKTVGSNGTKIWDLFSYDSNVANAINNISPIPQNDWSTLNTDGNRLFAGESLSNTSSKKYLISTNKKFKLEFTKDGQLKLKAAVYGCFPTNTKNINSPMYTNAITGELQSYYIYQTDLSHPKVGNIYYNVTGPNGTAIKQIDRKNSLLKNGSEYMKIPNYMPSNDINPNIHTADAKKCQEKCNNIKDCNYVYVSDKNKCMLGNKIQPAYIPRPSDSADKYSLYLRNKEIDTTNIKHKTGLTKKVEHLYEKSYRDFTPKYFGELLKTDEKIGEDGNPIKKDFDIKTKELLGGTVSANKKKSVSPQSKHTNPKPKSTLETRKKDSSQDDTTVSSNISSTFSNSLSGFRSGPIPEGFDKHDYSDPGEDCGTDGTKNTCYTGVKDGQIIPLKAIAQDYSTRLKNINAFKNVISANIDTYNTLYDIMNKNAVYDFSGNQPVILSGDTDLLTEMKNDSKKLALQTNNMYIAGSILTTTLLVSAIYLGRS